MENYTNRTALVQPQQPYGWYFATRDEALNWRIAPGNLLVFMDPDRTKFYTKSLGYSTYDKPEFAEYELIRPVDTTSQQNITAPVQNSSSDTLKNDISDLKNCINSLTEAITNMNQKPKYYNQDKKEGGNK